MSEQILIAARPQNFITIGVFVAGWILLFVLGAQAFRKFGPMS